MQDAEALTYEGDRTAAALAEFVDRHLGAVKGKKPAAPAAAGGGGIESKDSKEDL